MDKGRRNKNTSTEMLGVEDESAGRGVLRGSSR